MVQWTARSDDVQDERSILMLLGNCSCVTLITSIHAQVQRLSTCIPACNVVVVQWQEISSRHFLSTTILGGNCKERRCSSYYYLARLSSKNDHLIGVQSCLLPQLTRSQKFQASLFQCLLLMSHQPLNSHYNRHRIAIPQCRHR